MEFEKAMDSLMENIRSGVNHIPGELLKHCGNEMKDEIWNVMVSYRKDSEILQGRKGANLVTIFKKGD